MQDGGLGEDVRQGIAADAGDDDRGIRGLQGELVSVLLLRAGSCRDFDCGVPQRSNREGASRADLRCQYVNGSRVASRSASIADLWTRQWVHSLNVCSSASASNGSSHRNAAWQGLIQLGYTCGYIVWIFVYPFCFHRRGIPRDSTTRFVLPLSIALYAYERLNRHGRTRFSASALLTVCVYDKMATIIERRPISVTLGPVQMTGFLFIACPPEDSLIEGRISVLGIFQVAIVGRVGEPVTIAITIPEGPASVIITFELLTNSFLWQVQPRMLSLEIGTYLPRLSSSACIEHRDEKFWWHFKWHFLPEIVAMPCSVMQLDYAPQVTGAKRVMLSGSFPCEPVQNGRKRT